jgi:hypothetical protein
MRATVVAVLVGVLCLVGCLPTKDRVVTCTKTSDCDQGFVCNFETKQCVCDGTDTRPGCKRSEDARPAGPEAMSPTDTVLSEDLSTDRPPNTQLDTASVSDSDSAADAAPDAATDTAMPDTRPIECTSSVQCPAGTPICTSNTCAACTASSQCLAKDPGNPICATVGAAAGQCVQCADDSSCKSLAGTPACDTARNLCVECTSAANCLGAARACDLTKNKCVECADNTTCSGAAPICDVSANKCAACTAASQCLAKDVSNPACATSGLAAGQCVQCTDDSSCKALAGSPACNTAKNKCVECTGHGHCLPAAPLCDTTANRCLPCKASNECALLADPKRAVCSPAGSCVQCTKNADCSGDTPLCDASTNKCVPCTASTQCAALADAKRAICSTTGACVECTDNATCGGNTPICDAATNKCAACKATTQCTALSDAKRAVCNLTSGACVECTASTTCAGGTPICNTSTNKCAACSTSTECAALGDPNRIACASSTGFCVACTGNPHCAGSAGTPYCETGANKCVECLTSTNCSGAKPICSNNLCGACKSNDECLARDAATKICATSGSAAGSCVACTSNSHCGGSTPVCDTANNSCRACAADSECAGIGPGVCMKHQDFRCASDAETVVVTSTPTLPSSFPTGKRLVIIRGSVTGTVEWTLSGGQVTIIGQSTGVLNGNGSTTTATMHLTGGDFFMRDLSITGGSPGLWADGTGAIARLDHVSVSNNTSGGILLDGAAFEIKNTTVNGNGPNLAGTTPFGGILILNTPSAGPQVLSFSTINTNGQIGVVCGTGAAVTPAPPTVMVTGNTGGQKSGPCDLTPCTTASSSCGAQP